MEGQKHLNMLDDNILLNGRAESPHLATEFEWEFRAASEDALLGWFC